MNLTKKDLKQVQELIEKNNNVFMNVLMSHLIPILNQFATKDDFKRLEKNLETTKEDVNELKDDVAGLHIKFDRTYTLLKHQVDLNTKDIVVINKHLRV